MAENPKPNEIYRHFKGNLYRIVTLAIHSETREQMVVYQALYGDFSVYVRPLSMFMSKVDREKYPDATQEYRFALVPEVIGQQSVDDALVSAASPQQLSRKESSRTLLEGQPLMEQPSMEQPLMEQPLMEQPSPDALDARLMAFLDADSYREKLNLLVSMQPQLTDDMVNTMAVSLDVEIDEGAIEERFQALKSCLLMLEKYECSRLR